jgi:hypothetical protein
MAVTTHTILSRACKTPASIAFSHLLECLSDLVALAYAEPEMGCFHDDEHPKAELTIARSTVLAAARAVLDTPIEHPLDGMLNRLATLCELQMTLDCPDERAHLYAKVMDNLDIFKIPCLGASHSHVRNLQRVFFTHYADLVKGPTNQPSRAQTDANPQFAMIPA